MNDIKSLVGDRIYERLQKILELAKRGDDGEMKSAKHKLNLILNRYELTFEDLVSNGEKRTLRVIKYRSRFERQLLVNSFVFLFGTASDAYENSVYRKRNGKMEMYFELTDLEYIQLVDFFDFHKEIFRKQIDKHLDLLFTAYLNKNDIFDSNPKEDKKSKKSSGLSWEDLLEMSSMMDNMERSTYHKKLNK